MASLLKQLLEQGQDCPISFMYIKIYALIFPRCVVTTYAN